MNAEQIIILGIGCPLYADQGFGVHVIQVLKERYELPEHVLAVDGGLLGVALTGTIARADHVIAVDAFCNGGSPGDLYRLEENQIFERLTGKHHVQHVEFLEALAHCRVLNNPPQTVLLGIEPGDTTSVGCELTPQLHHKIDDMIDCIVAELDRLGVTYRVQ